MSIEVPRLRDAVDAARVVAELRELARVTGDERGAQRLCWSDHWVEARDWMRERIEELPVSYVVDPAGNAWTTLAGGDADRAVLIGGHIDSVPNGGWLDGSLNLLAGLEVVRALARRRTPPVTVRLIDWADEEGARFGYGLVGSSAASGTLDLTQLRGLTDRQGHSVPEVLAERGVELDRMLEARRGLEGAVAYVELHIEQGPVLEQLGLPLAVVIGTAGVERHVVTFVGQASHAGSTPMESRRDPLAAVARLVLGVREDAIEAGGLATAGSCVTRPGIATATPAQAALTLDQRHFDSGALADLVRRTEARSRAAAAEEHVSVEWEDLWRIKPIRFDDELIELADDAVLEVAGKTHRMASGPLHDAAEVARAGIPTVMLFVQSLRGLSHTREEDTRREHIELSVRALAATVDRVLGQHS